LRERAYQLFGADFIGDLIEVQGETGELRVRGFVSSPSATRTTRESQYFFINGRYVRDKLLGKALGEAYRAMMPSGTYPSAMIFVELPPQEVDVNVHPAKTEVRFVRPTVVHDLLRDCVRSAIGSAKAAATPYISRQSESKDFIGRIPAAESAELADAPEPIRPPLPSREELRDAFRLQSVRPIAPAPVQQKINLSFTAPEKATDVADTADETPFVTEFVEQTATAAEVSPADLSAEISGKPPEESAAKLNANISVAVRYSNRLGCLGAKGGDYASSNLKPAQNLSLNPDEINPLGQLHNSFIIAADRAGLLVIDQHVAHERILFEQHWRALSRKRIDVQRLLLPETVDLTPAQAAAFDQLLPELEENGFELGRLSGRTVAIKSVPAMLQSGIAQSLLTELLDAIEQERRGLTMDELRAEIAASLACRAAIKINMSLAPEKMRWLIDELLKADNPATCPHGRPIILRMTSRDIEKGFQRT
jgi:DNA mismatch repair protein MutL